MPDISVCFPPSRRGKCCPFFSFCVFCVRSGVFCRFFCHSSPLRVAFWKKCRERTFVFGCWCCVGHGFFGGFLPMFLLYFWRFAPETVWKNSLDVRSVVFWVVPSSLGFSPTSFLFWFFLRDKDQVVASCFSAFFSGCHSGPRAFLGFSLDLLSLFLGTRGGKGFPVLLLSFFSPFVLRPHFV